MVVSQVSLVALQARVTQLASLVAPSQAATTTDGGTASGTDATEFDLALERALGISTAATTVAAPTRAATGRDAGSGLVVPSGVSGQDLVDAARAYVGVPYLWGGESPSDGGLDCSGLVRRSLADLGVTGVPRVARDQATLGTPVASLVEAQPGDLLVFDGGQHIGIYVGDGQMIDAPHAGKTVQQRAVYETPTTIRRVLPSSVSGTPALGGAAGAVPSLLAVGDLDAQRAVATALLSGSTA